MLPLLLKNTEAAALLGMSKTTFYQLVKQPGFPCARQLSPRTIRWVRTELLAFQARSRRPSLLMDAKQVAETLLISKRRLYELAKLPDFPRSRSLGPRSTRWLRADIERYAAGRQEPQCSSGLSLKAVLAVQAAMERPISRGEVVLYLAKKGIPATEEAIAVASEQLRMEHLARFMVQVSTHRKARK